MIGDVWTLTIVYWFHMLATVVWIGGLSALAFIVLPSSRKALDDEGYFLLLERYQHRLDWMGWLSLAVLFGTGLLQMSAHPNYDGFFSIETRWAAALFAKHLVIFGMIGVNAYLTWGVFPQLRRMALLRARGHAEIGDKASGIMRQNAGLLYLNLVLGIVVLALTALARVS
jgi:uncharacterized membrane protein